MEDSYLTVAGKGEGYVNEKMSRFLSFAFPVKTREEAQGLIRKLGNEYHDSRHVCWAWMLGPERKEWMLNDNGEPSGTAGKPILGQINSRLLTDVLVVVVRYFGGIKLGTPGLIAAYREAAALALDDAGIKECFQMKRFRVTFPYQSADGVMKIMKGGEAEICEREFDNTCSIIYEVRVSEARGISGKLGNVPGAVINELAAEEEGKGN